MAMLRELAPDCSMAARAGSGILLVQFEEFQPSNISKLLIGRIRPAAIAAGGACVVWAAGPGLEATHQAVFGPDPGDRAMMRAVKSQFDPAGILNPGRFIYGVA
jgi:FAD/FMN-containing dehydrogenase